MSVSSNYHEIQNALFDLADALRLTRRPKGSRRNVGEQILDLTAEVIAHRTVDQQLDPAGAPLAPLSGYTLSRKARLGYPSTISVETGHMMSPDQVRGERQVSDASAEMTYGTDADARGKAEMFQDPKRPNQPDRPFFDLGKTGEQFLDAFIEDEILGPHIDSLS